VRVAQRQLVTKVTRDVLVPLIQRRSICHASKCGWGRTPAGQPPLLKVFSDVNFEHGKKSFSRRRANLILNGNSHMSPVSVIVETFLSSTQCGRGKVGSTKRPVWGLPQYVRGARVIRFIRNYRAKDHRISGGPNWLQRLR